MGDLEFLKKCFKNDRDAWDEFIERYSELIYKYIIDVFRSRGSWCIKSAGVDDAFQEFFLFISKDKFKKLKTYKAKNGCSLASWLRRVVINFSQDYLRGFKPAFSLDTRGCDDNDEFKQFLSDDTLSVKEALSLKERHLQLKKYMRSLDKSQRRFIEVYLDKNGSPRSLARSLGISSAAANMRKARMLKILKKYFQSKRFF